MLLSILFIVLGLLLLIKGADWLVEGAASIATALRVSQLTIGLTIVAFGTSLPELTVNLFSSFSGANDIAIGNVVGSNICNILLILGISSILAPLAVQTSTVWKEIPLSLLAAGILFAQANDILIDGADASILSRTDGLTFLAFFVIFLWYIAGMRRLDPADDKDEGEHHSGFWTSCGFIALGLVLLIGGGRLTVMGATAIAELLGVSQALIGLTIVAVGTSLPELATSTVAAVKGKADLAVGNVVGSNIFNIFWILGVSSLINPLRFEPAMNVDLLMVVIATLMLFLFTHTGWLHRRLLFWRQRKGHVITRSEGWTMLASYALYVGYLVWRG
ncbi:MAG: calcium/sodium antiporter [Candidatus Peribacteraceae bacterium]